MKLSNHGKHKLAVKLLSDYLVVKGYEHLVFSNDDGLDIYVPSSETCIKVFCNFAGAKNIKINRNFEAEEGVLYLVIKPTTNNTHGFSCIGGDKSVVDNAVKTFDTKGSPKNIQIDKLSMLSIKKYIDNKINTVEKEILIEPVKPVIKCISSNIKNSNVIKCHISTLISYIPVNKSSIYLSQY